MEIKLLSKAVAGAFKDITPMLFISPKLALVIALVPDDENLAMRLDFDTLTTGVRSDALFENAMRSSPLVESPIFSKTTTDV